jgi:oligoribonuclease
MSDSDFPTKLLWIDLEMTGLNPKQDLILEVAAVVTDFDFKELARYESIISHDINKVIRLMNLNEWWSKFPDSRDAIIKRIDDGESLKTVEGELVRMVKQNFGNNLAILSGNSIHQDRKFVENWWPELNKLLHYRMFDVTSLKIYMSGKFGVEYEKRSAHRAVEDIQESMDEWKYYMNWLSENTPTKD